MPRAQERGKETHTDRQTETERLSIPTGSDMRQLSWNARQYLHTSFRELFQACADIIEVLLVRLRTRMRYHIVDFKPVWKKHAP